HQVLLRAQLGRWRAGLQDCQLLSFALPLRAAGKHLVRDADRSAERLLASAGGCLQRLKLCRRAYRSPERAAISENPSGVRRSCHRHHTLSVTSLRAQLSATLSSACPTG